MTGGPGKGGLEGGGQVEHGPGEDDVVVGAEEEGDHHSPHPRPLQDGAELVQRSYRSPPSVLPHRQLHEEEGNPRERKVRRVRLGLDTYPQRSSMMKYGTRKAPPPDL